MPTSTMTPVNSFLLNMGLKKFDFSTDALKVALTNNLPLVTNTQLADIVQIAETGGYVAGGYALAGVTWTETAGVPKLVIADKLITAVGAGQILGPFRYAVIYDDTSVGDLLFGWLDYGMSTQLSEDESILLNFDDVNGFFVIQ